MLIQSLVTHGSFIFLVAITQAAGTSMSAALLPPQTALPIVFTNTVDAHRAKVGDPVLAKTIQVVKVAGLVFPSGALVHAHVVAVSPASKQVPDAKTSEKSELGVQFDSISSKTTSIPLDVYVRAIADPISSWTAVEPFGDTKWDPDSTVIQVGGDILTPSQTDVVSRDGRIVARNIKGGVFGKLRAASGDSPDGCDESSSDESLAIFSAAACGLYGFSEVQMEHSGRTGHPSMLLLVSSNGPAKIWKQSTALLEERQP